MIYSINILIVVITIKYSVSRSLIGARLVFTKAYGRYI